MLKRTIGLSLLCIAGNAYSANIVVNTTEDEFNDTTANDKCSLREAVELVNRTGTDGKIPTAGFGGCNGDTAVIVLESGKTYSVTDKFQDKEIKIKKPVAINSLPTDAFALKYNGENNAVIQYVGTTGARLFNISDDNPNIANISVSFNQVDFIGCNASGNLLCSSKGGIIYNQESLSISFARMKNGNALEGGAVYNEGIANSGDASSSAGQLTFNNLYIHNNKALQGAAIYSAQPRYEILNSVFRDNTATLSDGTGTVVYVNQPVLVNDTTTATIRSGNIRNSVFFNNQARVANLRDGMIINNSTIIRNKAGVVLDSIKGAANFSNSIVAENGTHDCIKVAGNTAKTNNLVYKSGDCGDGETGNRNTRLVDNPSTVTKEDKLIAGSTEGICDKPPADGLLCPFRFEKEIFNGFFKPRLLAAYTTLSDSRIVNRGRVSSDGTLSNSLACESTDQRGKARETVVLCDIGSIELLIEDKGKIGKDIKFGETAEIDLIDFLGDGELWPKGNCDAVYGALPAGQVWQEGCMRFVVGKEANKGELFIDSDAMLKYVPLRNYHGSDNFSIDVTTTTTRFSQAVNDRSLTLRGTIVQEPGDSFENKSVSTSGGSIGLFSILGMLGLAWIRRRSQGV